MSFACLRKRRFGPSPSLTRRRRGVRVAMNLATLDSHLPSVDVPSISPPPTKNHGSPPSLFLFLPLLRTCLFFLESPLRAKCTRWFGRAHPAPRGLLTQWRTSIRACVGPHAYLLVSHTLPSSSEDVARDRRTSFSQVVERSQNVFAAFFRDKDLFC